MKLLEKSELTRKRGELTGDWEDNIKMTFRK